METSGIDRSAPDAEHPAMEPSNRSNQASICDALASIILSKQLIEASKNETVRK